MFDPFAFTHVPFSRVPDVPFLEPSREETLRRLGNFLGYRGFAVITGPPGTGKTVLLGHLCRNLQPNEHRIIYVPFSVLRQSDMLRHLCSELGIPTAMSASRMIRGIQERIREIQPVNPVIVLDEIQQASHPTLDILRLLTNFDFEDKKLISVLMAGNDEFLNQLKLRINEPLRQRVTCYARMTPLSRECTGDYVRHAFENAGAHQQIITPQAVGLVHDCTSGIPRLIDSVMLAALETAAGKGSRIIELEHVRTADELVSPKIQETTK
jgi:type II secretory pathway predicted ATPase ExeA